MSVIDELISANRDDASSFISQRMLGTEEIVLIHYTECGMLTLKDQDVKDSNHGGDRHLFVLCPRGLLRTSARSVSSRESQGPGRERSPGGLHP